MDMDDESRPRMADLDPLFRTTPRGDGPLELARALRAVRGAVSPGEAERLAARFMAVFDALPLALALVDQRLLIVHANPRFLALTGIQPAQIGHRYVHDTFPVEDCDLTAAVIAAARGLPGVSTTVLVRCGDAGRSAMASCLPIPDAPTEPHVLVVLRELRGADGPSGTDAARDAILAALPRELPPRSGAHLRAPDLDAVDLARSRERRLAAVGQLAAGVMHDVNNALNPIVAASYLLDIHADDPVKVRQYAARIAAAAETGAATAARVGRFLRQDPVDASDRVAVDLGMLAEEVLAMTHPLWAERAHGGPVQLVTAFDPAVLIHGVAGEVREALLNLVNNALDAMARPGKLSARVYREGEQAVAEIADDGVGMPPEVAERAFDPFFTTKGKRGSGLGLAEVYGIMRRHGGHAELRSEPGGGTNVRLVFPVAAASDVEVPPARPARSARRVLVVEDNADGREFTRALLQSDGHGVEVVAGVHEALALLTARQATDDAFDVVVTDIGLLDGSGWELALAVRSRWPDVRVGLITGWDAATDPQADVHFVLRKPIRTQHLLAAVGGD